MILGLDVSTTCTGFAIIDFEGNLIETYAVRTDKKVNKKMLTHYERLDTLKQKLQETKRKYQIQHIFIEAPLLHMSSNSSTAGTMSKLQAFNGAFSYLVYTMFRKEPIHIQFLSARKTYGVVYSKGMDVKKEVLKLVVKKHPEFVVELTRKGNPIKGTYDRSDALVIANHGLLELNAREEEANS